MPVDAAAPIASFRSTCAALVLGAGFFSRTLRRLRNYLPDSNRVAAAELLAAAIPARRAESLHHTQALRVG
ncbi:MAG: hypothetical protein WBQ79_07315 [Acidobacteriaceae bacterium]